LLAVFELVLLMIVPRDLPVNYYALYAVQKVHFIITLICVKWGIKLYSLIRLTLKMSVIMKLQCIIVLILAVCLWPCMGLVLLC